MAKTQNSTKPKENDFESKNDKPIALQARAMSANPKVMSKQELEDAADKAAKKATDDVNTKRFADELAEEVGLAKVPLTDGERTFIDRIEPMMKSGREIDQPSAAEIKKYSKLVKRLDVPQKETTNS